MKLIINRESNPAIRSTIRREFIKDSKYISKRDYNSNYAAYMLLLELLSHQSGFITSKGYLQDNLGWTDKMWKKNAKILEEKGHLCRYRQPGTNNWTFVVYEFPKEPVVNSKKKKEKHAESKEETREEGFILNPHAGVWSDIEN